MEGKYTVEKIMEERNIGRQSAINLLSRLKKQNLVQTSGGGKQKRIYTIHKIPKKKTNGFYDVINKYNKEKLHPKFEHYVNGRYTIEHAIIDGIEIGDVRTLDATKHLFNQVHDWKRLFELARKKNLKKKVIGLYEEARKSGKIKRMPSRYK